MEHFESKDIYTPAWFRNRAMDSLKKTGEKEWDYSDSLLLYTPGTEGEYESIQKDEDPYSELITAPERAFLSSIAESVVEQLPDSFEFIDLGPGTANKEQYIFDAAKKAGKSFVYRPVDISRDYLNKAAVHATQQGIETLPVQSSFEALATELKTSKPRFVSLGLTFTNYNAGDVIPMLRNITGDGGAVFIDAQMRERSDMQRISEVYARDVRVLADPKIALLGLDPHTDISERIADDGIRMWFTVKNPGPLAEKGVAEGDKLLMFQSLRYTRESFEQAVAEHSDSYTIFDTEGPFVGALLK